MKTIVLLAIVSVLIPVTAQICVGRDNEWAQFGSVFLDPLCDVWCHLRKCGSGKCLENPNSNKSNKYECVCEKCYRNGDGNVIKPDDDGFEGEYRYPIPYDEDSQQGSSTPQYSRDTLYRSQSNYDNNEYN
ncbi:unnamed protein product [Caenorhabditis bovis]|uniref:Uncharacterized protein n=1 Tax=Caenorhabditis bovis TaxID=2654633 RepID=A0A8S1EDN8_9PELO|nr:unnamed protein product [Caenorhabditis bovis]